MEWIRGHFAWAWSSKGVKLTSHLYVVQRVRIHRAIPPLCCMPLWHVQVQLTVLVQFEDQERLFCILLHIKARVL